MRIQEKLQLKGIIGLKLLGIDTSGKIAAVALCDENTVLAQTTILTKLTHSQVILPLCKEMLLNAGVTLEEIDGIAVADGPGSYTGLRIGISAVKALAFALNKPCIGISTLESLAYNINGFNGIVSSIMSARQDLVYTASFSLGDNKVERITEDRILSKQALFEELNELNRQIIIVGDSAKNFCNEFPSDKFILSAPHLRLQLASSLCYAAYSKELSSPEKLDARYLQPTKAEKDRTSNKLV